MITKFKEKIGLWFAGLTTVALLASAASAAVNITSSMQIIWDLVGNLVDNTDSIIGLFLISVIIIVMAAISSFIKKTLDKSMRDKP